MRIKSRHVKRSICATLAFFIALFDLEVNSEPVVDWQFDAEIVNPMYPELTGPIVLIDDGHRNYHTKSEGYWPFSVVLEKDGYLVGSIRSAFAKESLASAKILVIANAIHPQNQDSWARPIHSAFTDLEIDVVEEYVRKGGSLFLIFDHMPFSGAAQRLANRFGVDVVDGFVFGYDSGESLMGANFVFRRERGDIGDHPITRGRNQNERIAQVATFTGSAMLSPGGATSILNLNGDFRAWIPKVAWEFDSRMAYLDVKGWCQGMALEHGKGRVVIFSEAAMFTSQRIDRIGLRHRDARDNQQLLLNIVHWLSRKI